jgi:hypothetical protein
MDSSGISFSSSDPLSQSLTGIAIVILIYVILGTLAFIYNSFMAMWRDRVELFPDTYPSGSKMWSAIQNPSSPEAKTIYPSDNQGSGIEFSYSMFINLNSSTFANGDASFYHILHKGYSQVYPLLGPGIFAWGNKNTLRVFMNCYKTWDNWTDIDNIPVDKWFHLVVSCKGSGSGTALYIYLNGNLKTKVALAGNTPPYQNYGNVYAFSGRKMSINTANTPSLNQDPMFAADSSLTAMKFNGSASGMISRVFYFSYALTYSEIQSLMNMGPSPKVASNTAMYMPPYLTDTWWTNDGTKMD